MDHFHSQLSGLRLEDMKAFFILPSEKLLEDLGVRTQGLGLRQKLLASLPGPSRAEGKQYLEKIYIDTDTWKPSKMNQTILQIVQQALWEDQKLQLRYQKADGVSTDRVVCPLGLVAKGSVWYLAAMNEEGEYRNFRLSRIVQADIQAVPFTRPENFNLRAYWQESKLNFTAALPSLKVEVLAAPEIIGRMTFTDKFVVKLTEDVQSDAHMVPVTISFHTEQEAVEYVLGFGGAMKLIQPEYLIDKIVQQARAVIEMYG